MQMDILIIIGLLILGCLLNLLWEPAPQPANKLAKGYVALVITIAIATWLYFFAGIKNAVPLMVLNVVMHYGTYLAHLVLGFLAANIMFKVWLKDTATDHCGLKAVISTTLWGISITIANSFIVATVGKSMNMPYMIGFFKQSGYAVWFLYFIMAAEAASALGILLHFKLRTGIYASSGLILIMIGAICTHLHNRDPLSDSYAAISELINLILSLSIYFFEKQIRDCRADTQIYIV
jgi:hypothetical protein